MDYQDINNYLNSLELDNSNRNVFSSLNKDSPTPQAQTYFNPTFNSRNLQYDTETINKFNKNRQETSDKLLNRHFQLVPKEFGNKVDERTINVQDSTKKNINMAQSQLSRNTDISYIKNVPIMDYNKFSENYKNKDVVENDQINLKMNDRENIPSRRL